MACRKELAVSRVVRFLETHKACVNIFSVACLLSAACTATASNSLPIVGFCDYCSSSASFSTEAEHVSFAGAPSFEGNHQIYIVNPYSSDVRLFQVSRWFEIGDLIPRSASRKQGRDSGSVRRSRTGFYHAEAIAAPADPDIEQALVESIQRTHEFRKQIAEFVDFDSLNLPVELNSAIDLVGPEDSAAGLNRNRMTIALNRQFNDRIENLAPEDRARRIFNRVISQSGLLNNFTITIQFPDGTFTAITIARILEGFQGDPNLFEMEIQQSSVQGPGLLAVPGSTGQFAGFSYFGDPDIVQELMQLARRYGIRVTGPGGATPPSNGSRMSCEISGENIKCTITEEIS